MANAASSLDSYNGLVCGVWCKQTIWSVLSTFIKDIFRHAPGVKVAASLGSTYYYTALKCNIAIAIP